MARRSRLDAELVRRGLARSREHAVALIAEGRVAVAGSAATKPATGVEAGTPVVVRTDPDEPSWVSRGAHKLIGALDAFPVPVEGRRVLDAGASTGGFTEVVLSRGAAEVVAVDVGYGELAWSLRTDERVHVHERTNVRTLTPEAIGGPVDLVVADLSFISLRLVLPALTACAREDADLLPMVKPQFEVGRARLGAGGVVRDPEHRVQAVLEVAQVATSLGWGTAGVVASPLPGPGRQRGVLPVAATGRRGGAGGSGSSSSGGGAAVTDSTSAERGAHRRVLLAVHTGRRDIVELAQTSAARLTAAGIVVRLLEDEAPALDIADAEVVPADAEAACDAEIVMVFGGDGTFLRAAELARFTDAALMGVNLGRVGFLAETEPEAVEETLTAIERCEYSVEERLALQVDVLDADGTVAGSTWALNEVSVEKAERSRVLDVVLAIDGRPLTSFGCDGVLCATPTGSTAYAFSAGGPVVWPDVEALLLVPSNAHALFARPLVTSPNSVLSVAVPADGNRARVSADGRRMVEIPDGGRVDVAPGRAAGPDRPRARVHLRRPAGGEVRPARPRIPRRPAPRRSRARAVHQPHRARPRHRDRRRSGPRRGGGTECQRRRRRLSGRPRRPRGPMPTAG